MPRGSRLDAPGTLHHVMARGLDRQVIFRGDRDRADFVQRLAALAQAGAVIVYAWALLPNHFHLLLRTGNRPLARKKETKKEKGDVVHFLHLFLIRSSRSYSSWGTPSGTSKPY